MKLGDISGIRDVNAKKNWVHDLSMLSGCKKISHNFGFRSKITPLGIKLFITISKKNKNKKCKT